MKNIKKTIFSAMLVSFLIISSCISVFAQDIRVGVPEGDAGDAHIAGYVGAENGWFDSEVGTIPSKAFGKLYCTNGWLCDFNFDLVATDDWGVRHAILGGNYGTDTGYCFTTMNNQLQFEQMDGTMSANTDDPNCWNEGECNWEVSGYIQVVIF